MVAGADGPRWAHKAHLSPRHAPLKNHMVASMRTGVQAMRGRQAYTCHSHQAADGQALRAFGERGRC